MSTPEEAEDILRLLAAIGDVYSAALALERCLKDVESTSMHFLHKPSPQFLGAISTAKTMLFRFKKS